MSGFDALRYIPFRAHETWDRELIAGDTVRLALPANAGSAEAGAMIAEKVR